MRSPKAAAEATSAPPAGTWLKRLETKGKVWWGSLKGFILWFLAFFGVYASSSVCPCCGAPGCPVGAGAAAVVGALFGAIMAYGKSILTRLRGWLYGLSRSNQD